MRAICVLALLFLIFIPHTAAQPRVKLSPETVAAFDSYVADSELVLKKRLDGELSFLWMDEDPERRPKVRDGKILIENLGTNQVILQAMLQVWQAMHLFTSNTIPICRSACASGSGYSISRPICQL